MPGKPPFTEIIDELIEVSETYPMCIGDLMRVFGDRGFGALLLIPCIMVILPVGMIPGVPDIAAIFMILLAIQMALGVERLWLPRRILEIEVQGERLRPVLTRFRPIAVRLDANIGRRFAWFAESRFATETIAGVTIVLSLLIIVVGFVPGVPALFCIPLSIFALGLVARNGLVILAGYLICACVLGIVALIFW